MKKSKNQFGAVLLAIASFLIVLFLVLMYVIPKADEPKPFYPIPTEAQLEWNDLEFYMFMHFGPNTFTDVEWGDGKEDPKVFNPTDLDCKQWAKLAKDAGMKGIIITAKHHDGFCLWPSQYSTHTVRESPWKDGKGDVLRELSDACKEYGLKFGVYLSPWDQNHPAYGTAEYNQIFANTLEEVLSSYGDVYEQWFDGANGGNNKHVYDWDMFHNVVYKHQPNAVIFSDVGPGCRWIGNESGFAGDTNWSKIDTTGYGPGIAAPKPEILNQGLEKGEAWIPGEVDVSIRPGWFYSPSTNDKVKTVEELMNIYYSSVGRNANLLLNVPPSRTGKIHPNDSTRLMEFRHAIDKAFENNLTKGATINASNERGSEFSASNLLDGNKKTYWATDDGVIKSSIELTLPTSQIINTIVLQEYIALGQRISSFNVECYDELAKAWIKVADATTIGHKRILKFANTETSKVRVNILNALADPILLSNIELYNSLSFIETPIIKRKSGKISISSSLKDASIYYTLDASVPTIKSNKYTKEFTLDEGGIVKAILITKDDLASDVISREFTLKADNWKVVPTLAQSAIDDDLDTIAIIPNKQDFVLDMAKVQTINGFIYTPDMSNKTANIYKYELFVSSDKINWSKVEVDGIFNNIKNNPISQKISFAQTLKARYIKLSPLELTNTDSPNYAIGELGVIK